MLQYYNQVQSQYNTYDELFVNATGPYFNKTGVFQVADRGVPLNKIVVAKPILTTDATNTGYVPMSDLGQWTQWAYGNKTWYAGVAHWQYPSDATGGAIKTAT